MLFSIPNGLRVTYGDEKPIITGRLNILMYDSNLIVSKRPTISRCLGNCDFVCYYCDWKIPWTKSRSEFFIKTMWKGLAVKLTNKQNKNEKNDFNILFLSHISVLTFVVFIPSSRVQINQYNQTVDHGPLLAISLSLIGMHSGQWMFIWLRRR